MSHHSRDLAGALARFVLAMVPLVYGCSTPPPSGGDAVDTMVFAPPPQKGPPPVSPPVGPPKPPFAGHLPGGFSHGNQIAGCTTPECTTTEKPKASGSFVHGHNVP